MVKITHYEVYTDKGDGWKLEDRFSSEQRHEAINLSKEKEQEKLKVKIIRETFDVQDNSYQETVEYVSGLKNGKAKSPAPKPVSSVDIRSYMAAGEDEKLASGQVEATPGEMLKAVVKLITIIVLSLVFSNLLVTLLTPLVEDFVPEEKVRTVLFALFFTIFLGLAVPLILSKIPWYVFNIRRRSEKRPLRESRFYEKANNIIKLYQLNEYEPSIAPAWPEAPLEHKRYIVEFLKDIMSGIDSRTMFEDSFSKLGVKLVVYGGCMELSRYCGLKITEANSLLFEAFKILDGENADLEEFYDGKRSFSDNKIAVFLAGVGAHLMAQVIDGQPMDTHILKQSFDKWEGLLNGDYQKKEDKQGSQQAEMQYPCLVNIQYQLKFFDEAMPDIEGQRKAYDADVRNIIYNLLNKYRGLNVLEKDEITSIEYENTGDAAKFASEFIKDINIYKDDLNDENLLFLSKCNIIDKNEDNVSNPEDYITDVLEHTYNNEILVVEKIKNSMCGHKYEFEFLGEKRLNKSDKLVALYKLIY